MSFAEFWEEYKRDIEADGESVWNMSLERYNAVKEEARQIYEKYFGDRK